jgi:hypothetical protein
VVFTSIGSALGIGYGFLTFSKEVKKHKIEKEVGENEN